MQQEGFGAAKSRHSLITCEGSSNFNGQTAGGWTEYHKSIDKEMHFHSSYRAHITTLPGILNQKNANNANSSSCGNSRTTLCKSYVESVLYPVNSPS